MVKEGLPFVIAPIVLALLIAFLLNFLGVPVSVILPVVIFFIGLTLFMAFFFRDPQRTIPTEADIIVSAADGKVTRVEDRENGKFVSVFLSPVDVHINRAPIC